MNDFYEKIAVNVINELFKESLKSFKKISKWVDDKSKEHDLFGEAASIYYERIQKHYNVMKIFGMNKPIPLKEIFVRVNILSKITSRQHSTTEKLTELQQKRQNHYGWILDTKKGTDVVNSLDKFVVLGKPGSGKTTFLKHIILEASEGRLKKKKVPIFISLKDFADSKLDLLDYCAEEFKMCQIPKAILFLTNLLQKGKCAILLDGLDEVISSKQNDVTQQVLKFTESYPNNQFIITCRTASYNYTFERFHDVEIADFSEREMESFVSNWFNNDREKGKLCLEKIKASPSVS